MRACMAAAEVGDEQKREDPTVNRLVEKVCQLLGRGCPKVITICFTVS